jgi:DNA-directed RNA polymerase subunit H (RpoH/RPB5)
MMMRKRILSKFSENELSKIYVADKMARYYGAKIGDIFRIVRPSLSAGNNVFYRRVVQSSWDILFEINLIFL